MKNYKKINHFEPIAMVANKKQIKKIRKIFNFLKLEVGDILINDEYPYLINHYDVNDGLGLGTFYNSLKLKVYEKFNAETFLKTCGIVEDEPTTKVRNSVLLQLAENNSFSEEIIRKECPKLFESKKLELNKWQTPLNNYEGIAMLYPTNLNDLYDVGYGFDWNGDWVDKNYNISASKKIDFRLATPQEVETALINEFEKQIGIKYNNYNFNEKANILSGWNNDITPEKKLFQNGKWLNITPTDIITIVEKYGKDELQKYLDNYKN